MSNELLQAALHYAQDFGWAVFPVRAQNKKPYTPHGCKDAKADPRVIRAWWKRWPDASIGVATGSMSNFIVIDEDLDDEKGLEGVQEVMQWERINGALPETVQSITGRGGCHLYFKYSGDDIKNRAGILPGVDVRGEGGYVVVPPSIHPNGTEYAWECSPDEMEMAEVNETVLNFLQVTHEADKPSFKLPEMIQDGSRNDTLFRLASSLQSQGLPDASIYEAVHSTNASRCVTPLADDEVDTIVESALRYQKGELKILTTDVPEWHQPELTYKVDKDGNVSDVPSQTIANAEEIITFDENLYGRIRFNELAYSPYVYGNLPWEQNRGWREWRNSDDSNLRSYVEKHYGINRTEKIMDALTNVAHRYPINPVRQMLESAYELWDGNKYIENLLPSMLGAEKSEYNTAVLRIFMLGAIHRIYRPGCKFDYMMVLVGDQGKGKSTFLRLLALDDSLFNDNFNSLDGDKALEKLRGMWIVEMAELQATRRAKDVESIKSFITSRVDIYREPYGRRTEQRPRMCVLAGTSNPVDFLTDKTGNRRFLPVTCNLHQATFDMFADETETRSVMSQAWGEAMNEYKQCGGRPRLVLPKRLQDKAIAAQEAYQEEDPSIGIIQHWLDTDAGDRVCAVQIWHEALNQIEMPSPRNINSIHDIMRNNVVGWEYVGRQRAGEKYGVQRCYERKFDIVNAEIPFE